MSEFEIDMKKWIRKAGDNIDKFMLEFTQDIGEEVITSTPVDTGFLRGSWTVKLNSPNLSSSGSFRGPQGGGEAVNGAGATAAATTNITANLIGVKGGDIVYYNNNAGYGGYVEFDQNFVGNVINRASGIAERAARRVNK